MATMPIRKVFGDFDVVRAGSLLRSVSTRRLVRRDPVASIPRLFAAEFILDSLRLRGCHPSSSLLIALCGTCISEPRLVGRFTLPGEPTEKLESLDQTDPLTEESKDL